MVYTQSLKNSPVSMCACLPPPTLTGQRPLIN